MTMHPYYKDGHPVYKDGKPYWCETCPCCDSHTRLFKIKYATLDDSCGSTDANRYRLNISCSCKCLLVGTAPAGFTDAQKENYEGEYPITGTTEGVSWQKSIPAGGGPFADIEGGLTAAEQCDALQVDGCIGGCSWYSVRTWSPRSCEGSTDYVCSPICSARCLITGAVPNPIPEGKTAYDYRNAYPITNAGVSYAEVKGGPYTASCTQTAQEVAIAAVIQDGKCSNYPPCNGTLNWGYLPTYNDDGYAGSETKYESCDDPPAGYTRIDETYYLEYNCHRRYYVTKYGSKSGTCDSLYWNYQVSLLDIFMAALLPNCTNPVVQLVSGPYCTSAEAVSHLPP